MKVEEAASELRDLVTADEVFLTGSVKEVVPVVGLDESRLGDGQPGAWTRRLQAAYRQRVANTRSRMPAS